jgi:uncharacterized protein YoxC
MDLTKEYFDAQLKQLATKEDLTGLKEDLTGLTAKVDSLTHDVSGLRVEVATFGADLADIKKTLKELSERDRQDSDVFAKDILDLKNRMVALEKFAQELKTEST